MSSILPLLIAIFGCLRYVMPVLDPAQIGELRNIFTVSCGVSRYAQNVDAFAAEADKHLYAAKNAGKNQVMAGVD